MLRFARALPFVCGLLAAACGARSGLYVEEGSGGAGGTTSAPTDPTTTSPATTASTVTTTPTPAPICKQLVWSGAPLTPADNRKDQYMPSLVRSTDDGKLAHVVFVRGGWSAVEPSRVTATLLAPFIAWPQALDVDVEIGWLGIDGYAVAPARPEDQAGYSFLYYLPTNDFPSDMVLARQVSPKSYYEPAPPGVTWDAWEPAWPVALARSESGHLAAYGFTKDGGTSLSLGYVDANSTVGILTDVACANERFPAAVADTGGGFLIATATSATLGDCPPAGPPGLANRIEVLFLEEPGLTLSVAASIEEPDPILYTTLAKRKEGAYLVWQSTGASAFAPPPVRAVLLDEKGNIAGPVLDVTQDGQNVRLFAAGTFGDHLAVGWFDDQTAESPSLRLDVFDQTGTFGIGNSIPLGSASAFSPFPDRPPIAMLGSYDGSHMVVAWADVEPGQTAKVHVARFTCEPD